MEKNEEAAASANTAADNDEGDGLDFTPKRPLTAYQFEKKRQEDLDTYAREHENTETPATSGRASVIEEDGKVNISFSDYEQTYEVPNYEDSDPTPVYSDPNTKIDWGAGADDSAVDWQNRSSAEAEPIFVETERVNNDDIDDDKIIDEADIRSFSRAAAEEAESAYESPVNSAQDPTDYENSSEADAEGSEDAFSDFLNNFKRASLSKSMKKTSDTGERSGKGTYASSRPTPVAVPEQVKPATKKPVVSETSEAAKASKPVRTAAEDIVAASASKVETVVEDIIPDAKYRKQDDTDYESVPSRPTDIQDTKIKVSFDNDIIEEVISSSTEEARPNIDQSSSFANPEKPVDAAFSSKKPTPRKFETPEELDDGTYKGFVPDYSPTNPDNESNEPEEVSEYDEFKKKVHARKEENQAINAQIKAEATRQANLVKDFGKKGKIVFEDTDDLDNYAGFVPDYTPNTSNEEEFDFYKPHQVSSYAKYKKGSKPGVAEGATGRTTGFMRLTTDDEVETLFITHVPSTAKKVLKPQEIKNANFLINMSGKRLSKLFNSWMMLNVTTQTVRAFEKDDAEDAENYELKINGIKKLLTDNFGEINEIFLDSLVQRYYSKFLDE